MANPHLGEESARKLEQLRGWGWAHALDLIARGLEEDAARKRLAVAEAKDRGDGCE